MKVIVLASVLLLSAAEPETTIDCNLVRQYVAEHGKAKALVWARKHGYSWSEINEARKCLK